MNLFRKEYNRQTTENRDNLFIYYDEEWMECCAFGQEYLDEHDEIDDEEIKDLAVEYTMNSLEGELEFNANGCIYFEREIRVSSPEEINTKYFGLYVSYAHGGGMAYDAMDGEVIVLFKGWVHPSSVDWVDTINANLESDFEERELRLFVGMPVTVTSILVDGKEELTEEKEVFA